jgi:hypothetical protein
MTLGCSSAALKGEALGADDRKDRSGDRMKECGGPVEKAVELRRLTTCLDNY